jgi:ABC-type glutathione transport system ATPase component
MTGFPRRRGDAHRRTRSRQPGELSRQLCRLPGAQGVHAQRRGAGQCPFRQDAGAGGGLDPQGRRGAAHAQRRPRAAAGAACARRARGAARAAGQGGIPLVRGDASGKLVAELEHVSKRFATAGDKTVVATFSCRIQRGDKVGLIGANGTGKTTLLRLILGELQPMRARCSWAPRSKSPTSTSSAPSSTPRRRCAKSSAPARTTSRSAARRST